MKTSILLLFIFCSNLLYSQIQLDSVVLSNVLTEEVLVTQIHSYNSNGLLTKFAEPQYEFEIYPFYNAEDRFEKLELFDTDLGENQAELFFKYDSQMNLDTVSYVNSETGETDFFFALDYENNELVELSFYNFDSDENAFFKGAEYLYFYENGRKVKAETYYFDYDGNGYLIGVEDYEYVADQLIKVHYIDPDSEEELYYDSIYYNAAGGIEEYMEVYTDYYNPGELEIFYIEFDYEAGVDISTITYPKDFYEVNYILTFDDYRIPRLSFMAEQPASTYVQEDEERYDFFYSVFVGLDERKPAKPISIYPNPVGDYIVIKDFDQIKNFDIYSISGEKLYSANSSVVDSQDQKFLVNHLVAGMYTVVNSTINDEYYFSSIVKK